MSAYSDGMDKRPSVVVHVVAASKDGVTEYWVTATPRKQATTAVHLFVGPDWWVTLTNRQLTPEQIALLDLRRDDVRPLNID
jgi:hypothetical protein